MRKFEKAIYQGGQRSISVIKFSAAAAITVATVGAASSLTAATLAEGGALSAAEITTVKITSDLVAGAAAGASELATKGITAEVLGDEEARKELGGDAMGMAVGLGVSSTSIGLLSRFAPGIASKAMASNGDAIMRAFPGMSRKAAQKELEAYIIVKGTSFMKGISVNTSKGIIEGKDAKEIGLIALEEIGSTAFDLGKAGSGLDPMSKTEVPRDIYGKNVKERFKLTPERMKEAGKGFKEELKTKVKDELKGKVKE